MAFRVLVASLGLGLYVDAATCSDYNGIAHSSKHPSDPIACCAAACGTRYCGATDCNSGEGPGGDNCCASRITKNLKVCGIDVDMAPCMVPSGPGPAPTPPAPPSRLPEAWDWRDVNGTNWLACCGAVVRNHHLYPPASWGPPYTGGCASCWAFSSTSVMSDRLYIQSQGAVKALPAANVLLDCMPGERHCGYPGSAGRAYEYLKSHGIPDETCSPSTAALGGNAQHCTTSTPCAGICALNNICRNRTDGKSGAAWEGPLYGVESYSTMRGESADEIRSEIMANGPVAAGMCVDGGDKSHPSPTSVIMNYKGGIINASQGLSCTKVNHDVNLIGWGSESGLPYWIARNNWGTEYGEGGFFRIERGKNAFVIESAVRTVKPKVLLPRQDAMMV